VPTPEYILDLRRSYGQGLLLLPGVSAVVLRDDQVLLTQRTDNGHWSLPAGIVEPGEQPGSAMLRELVEETRVVAAIERLALLTADPIQVYPNGDRCQFVSMCFRCRYVSGDAQVGDEESTAVDWFPINDLPPDLSAIHLRRIECALADRDDCILDQ
jgi:ADP-ribose pyrophosphatase YjhB (NUDIX family)